MRLDLSSLAVQSFATSPEIAISDPADTGKGGPDSYCYICYETGNTVPSCDILLCEGQPVPDTYFKPCTIYNQTCKGCAYV
jgi:hypothetical protein